MKKLILGLVIGMMIGSATVALAADDLLGTEIKAVFAGFNLKINGTEKVLETTPLVYNGTSYLPVRDMANLVGYDVTYKADSRTIELNTTSTKGNVSSSTAITSNSGYGSLRSIAIRDGLEVSSKIIKKGNITLEIDSSNVSKLKDEPSLIQTPYGQLRFYTDGNSTLINIEDWNTVYANMKN